LGNLQWLPLHYSGLRRRPHRPVARTWLRKPTYPTHGPKSPRPGTVAHCLYTAIELKLPLRTRLACQTHARCMHSSWRSLLVRPVGPVGQTAFQQASQAYTPGLGPHRDCGPLVGNRSATHLSSCLSSDLMRPLSNVDDVYLDNTGMS
jgi:hypothetical protein